MIEPVSLAVTCGFIRFAFRVRVGSASTPCHKCVMCGPTEPAEVGCTRPATALRCALGTIRSETPICQLNRPIYSRVLASTPSIRPLPKETSQ